MTARLSPEPLPRPGEITITPWSQQSLGMPLYTTSQVAPSAGAWPSANLAIFVPFGCPEPMTVTKMFYGIGAAAGNIDIGIYRPDQTRLVSLGSTAAAGANTIQVGDVTDTVLPRGLYYLALVADTVTTLTVFRAVPAAGIPQSFGLLQQTSAFPLPDPATFAVYAQAYIPLFGLQGYRTIGP